MFSAVFSTYFGGWTDFQVETVLQEDGYNCTGRVPGVYGVIESENLFMCISELLSTV